MQILLIAKQLKLRIIEILKRYRYTTGNETFIHATECNLCIAQSIFLNTIVSIDN